MRRFGGDTTRRRGILQEIPVDNDSRCLACDGACCRSFASVSLTWGEYERLQFLGAARLHFSLFGPHLLIIENGCEFLSAGRCSIYADRPEICRRFTCTVVDGERTVGSPGELCFSRWRNWLGWRRFRGGGDC